jgi:hypothetical protein
LMKILEMIKRWLKSNQSSNRLRFDHLILLIINQIYLKKVWKYINFNDQPNIMPQNLQDLIQFLQSNNFKAECPNCDGKFDLSDTAMFDAENLLQKRWSFSE